MLYDYNGRMITETELDNAFRLYTAFQSGEIKNVDVNSAVAEAIMGGKGSYAVTLLAAANDMKRIDARKYLEENGKRICTEYINTHDSVTVGCLV